MRLYYMTTFETATKYILKERRMRFGQFDNLNDPFELMSPSMDNPDHRQALSYLRKIVAKTWGVICMGKHWKSPLMWAHYAKNHTGICLGFDMADEDAIQKVAYIADRVSLAMDLNKPLHGITYEDMMSILSTKYSQWSYEEEYRLFGKLDEADQENGHFYLPFGPDMILREVIVGTRCDKPLEWFRHLLTDVYRPVTIIKARPAFGTFTMVRKKDEATITVEPSVPGIST